MVGDKGLGVTPLLGIPMTILNGNPHENGCKKYIPMHKLLNMYNIGEHVCYEQSNYSLFGIRQKKVIQEGFKSLKTKEKPKCIGKS